MLDRLSKEAASSGTKIEMYPVRVELLDKRFRALVIRFEQISADRLTNWQVTQYKIPVDNRLIEVSLSARQSDASLWQPILERVKRSIRF